MAEFPALPLFTDAITADCGHLSDEEFGRYMRVLILMWRSPGCRIPKDANWLSKRLRMDALAYAEHIQPIMQEFCTADPKDAKYWIQKRLMKEYEYVQELTEKRRNAAAKRWDVDNKDKTPMQVDKPRTSRRTSKAPSTAYAPTPTPTPNINPLPPSGGDFEPDGSDKEEGQAEPPTRSRPAMQSHHFDVMALLHDKALQQAKDNAPDWDIYHLGRIYNEKIRSGQWQPPSRADIAFPAWVKSYTKGQKP